MVLPKLLFLHLSQFCLPHWIQVHSFGTPKTSASFKVVLLWSCASCWWRCCPSLLQWWCVTREGMTALGRLTSALCPTSTMQCLTNRDREEDFSVAGFWERSPLKLQRILLPGALSYLLLCSSASAVSPLKKPHLAWSHLKQLGQETSCSEHWINGLGLLHEWNPFKLLSMSGSQLF